jgi:uncharacterized membrane protein YidH (DUF202 family)
MKVLAVILIIVGVVALAYGGISYTRRDTVIDAGPIEVTADKEERVPISPIVGGILLAAGAVLLVTKRK